MIRTLKQKDENRVFSIWLETNIKTHNFISEEYWKSNYEYVKEELPKAEVYVYENENGIQGFAGLNDEYLEGIFVTEQMQSHGIGKLLIDFIKEKKKRLILNVYQKNTRAIDFYLREGFIIQGESMDEATGEKDYIMIWK